MGTPAKIPFPFLFVLADFLHFLHSHLPSYTLYCIPTATSSPFMYQQYWYLRSKNKRQRGRQKQTPLNILWPPHTFITTTVERKQEL